MKVQFSGIKPLLLLLVLLAGRFTGMAQQTYFMYIQSDNKQPFYVELNKKTYSSSGTGYLIVSKIPAGAHVITLGFTGSKQPAMEFACTIDSDAGFALKNYEEKGWGLFNLQTMAVIMGTASTKPQPTAVKPVQPDKPATTPAPPAQGSQFGDMLSQVVDDPTLTANMSKPQPPAPAKEATASQVKKPVGGKKNAPKPATVPVPATADTAAAEEDIFGNAATRGVIKTGEKQGEKGTDMVFIDFNSKGSDTVKIFIPGVTETDSAITVIADKPAADTASVPQSVTESVVIKDTTVTPKEGTAVSNPFYTKPVETGTVVKNEAGTVIADSTEAMLPEKKIAPYNSNCTGGMATDKDLDKLRKRMVGEGSDDKMMLVAKKAFKAKCYTTEQIKTLGMLFFTDESRYAFYDAAYPFVYDVSNFSSLETMLLDDYYKKRFRAMIRA